MNLWDVLIPAASGTLAAIVAFFAGKRKSNAEADGVIVNNAEKVIALYAKMAEKHEQRIEALEDHLKLQEQEIATLKEKYDDINLKYETERARNKNAVRENEILQEKYNNLNKRMNGAED